MNKLKEGCLYRKINETGFDDIRTPDENIDVEIGDTIMLLSDNKSWVKVLHKQRVGYMATIWLLTEEEQYELIEEQA